MHHVSQRYYWLAGPNNSNSTAFSIGLPSSASPSCYFVMPLLDEDRLVLRTALETLGAYQIKYSRLKIDMDSVLGQGGFGVVRCAHLGEHIVAVKILRSDESKDTRVAKRLVREMGIWSGLCNQNVLRLIGFHLSQTLDVTIIVCPIAPHGSLQDYVLREKPCDAPHPNRSEKALDTLNGLVYLHALESPVVHGDIKAESRAVLSDFGLAMAASEVPTGLSSSRGFMGSVRWCSPELLDDKPRSTASDV
ncbi:hypothetical protein FRB93_011891 [Tulasnella sp. JGI-2019a]|nr:hypothetical protein FRB93_011891 [Tulasnella sp. JGI-2019a]